MLSVGGSFDMNDAATLLLMPGLAAYAVAVVIAIGLFLLSRRDTSGETSPGGDTQLLASARAKEYRALLVITLAPLLILVIAPGLLLIHPVVAMAALVIFLLIASVVFRQMLRVISCTA